MFVRLLDSGYRSDPRYAVEYDFYALTAAVQLNVYNGVIMAWREKVVIW